MNVIMRLSLAIFVALCILPSAFAGPFPIGLKCQSCPENPLQSPEQCNMSSTEETCADFICIALTAELTNGTLVGMRGCFTGSAGNCTTSACNQRNGTLSGPDYFARCEAECCTEENCNTKLFPMLPEPSSTVDVVVSSTPVPNTTQPDTTEATKLPSSLAIKMRAFLYLPVFLLVPLDIMN